MVLERSDSDSLNMPSGKNGGVGAVGALFGHTAIASLFQEADAIAAIRQQSVGAWITVNEKRRRLTENREPRISQIDSAESGRPQPVPTTTSARHR